MADGDIADFAVTARTGAGDERSISLFLVDLTGPGVTRSVVETIDPTRSHARIDFQGRPAHSPWAPRAKAGASSARCSTAPPS